MCQFTFLLLLQTFLFYGIFFIVGLVFKFFPPSPNKIIGFRSTSELNNEKDWFITLKIVSNLILITSFILIIVSLAIKFLTHFLYQAFILYTIIDILLLLVAIFMIYFLTHDRLRKLNMKMTAEDTSEDSII